MRKEEERAEGGELILVKGPTLLPKAAVIRGGFGRCRK